MKEAEEIHKLRVSDLWILSEKILVGRGHGFASNRMNMAKEGKS